MKTLLNNKEDFDFWRVYNLYNYISYEEDEPKNYPCIVTFRIVDNDNSIYEDLYYEFVYLEDFEVWQN